MHEHVVAHVGAFGIQRGQHPQGAVVAVVADRAVGVASVVQVEVTLPAHCLSCPRRRRRGSEAVCVSSQNMKTELVDR